jgi:hypothetical protein
MDVAAREHGSRTAGPLEAHPARRRQGAAIQDVSVGIHRRERRGLLVREGHAANADGIVAVEITTAAISVLNTVIINLRCFIRAENSRLAVTAALSVAFPGWNFLERDDVGISAGDCGLSRITLARRRSALEIPDLCDADSVIFVTIALAIVLGRRAPDT